MGSPAAPPKFAGGARRQAHEPAGLPGTLPLLQRRPGGGDRAEWFPPREHPEDHPEQLPRNRLEKASQFWVGSTVSLASEGRLRYRCWAREPAGLKPVVVQMGMLHPAIEMEG